MAVTDILSPPEPLQRANHVCWVYDDEAAFHERAAAFLTAGVVAGDRLEYIGEDSAVELHRRLRSTAGFDALLDTERLRVRSLQGHYGADELEPTAPVAAYAAATRAALADGFAGLRVVAEATALVRTAAQRERFGRYEHLVDRYMLDHPFSAMCAYDVRELGATAVAEIACLHPQVSPGATAFQWFASGKVDVALAGEIDITSQEVFDRALARTMPLMTQRQFTVDARALGFIDHRGMLSLERHAREAGVEVDLVTDTPVVHRLAELLDLRAVRPGSAG